MAKKIEQVLETLSTKRQAKIAQRSAELATLKGLRQAIGRTQEGLAAALGVGQDTVSRIEQRDDILLSTLRRYVEAMGGKLTIIAEFPNRPPIPIAHIGEQKSHESFSNGRRMGKRRG